MNGNMNRKNPENSFMNLSLQKHVFSTYLTLRYGIAVIGALLPVVAYILGALRGVELQPSISAYYWAPFGLADAPSRDWFVGSLFIIAACLYLYKGFSRRENIALNIAAIFGLGVAVFPMEYNCESEPGKFSVHGFCAVAMFVCLVYVVWFRAGDTLSLLSRPWITRFRRAYKVLGAVMLASPLTAFALNSFIGPHTSFIFFVESAGIWAFAAYWWTKSNEMKRSGATAKVLRGEVSRPKEIEGGPLAPEAGPSVDLAG